MRRCDRVGSLSISAYAEPFPDAASARIPPRISAPVTAGAHGRYNRIRRRDLLNAARPEAFAKLTAVNRPSGLPDD
jgi:hypothetical protein